MKIADLQKKIAEILGVSSSEKELAFEVFISKICDILTDEITLKVLRVGFFQLKKGFTKSTAESLLFIPLSEELYRDSKNLFLNIPIPTHKNIDENTEADVFSIGVGKPILPLSEKDSHNTETSYAILRKSIEERVVEILSEADQLPNFNIWEDYYKSVRYIEHEEVKDTLNELTADLDFKEEFMAEDLTNNLLELSSAMESPEPEEVKNESHEISLYDLLGDYQIEEQVEDVKIEPVIEKNYNDSFEEDELEQKLLNVIEGIEDSSKDKTEDHFAPELIEERDDSEISHDQENYKDPEVVVPELKEKLHDSEISHDQEILIDEKVIESEFREEHDDSEKSRDQEILIDEKVIESEFREEHDDSEKSRDQEILIDEKLIESEIKEEQDDFELLPDQESYKDNEVLGIISDLEKSIEEIKTFGNDNDQDEFDNSGNEGEIIPESEEFEIEVPTQNKEIVFEIKRESKLDDVDLEAAKENDEVEPVYYLGLKNKNNEPIEWDWGDELKEEFGIEFLKEDQIHEKIENDNESSEKELVSKINQVVNGPKPKKPTLFEELDLTIKKEIEEVEEIEPHQVLEYSGTTTKYKFVEELPVRPAQPLTKTNFEVYNDPTEEVMKENEKEFSFGKIFLIIFTSFVIVGAIIVFLLMNNKDRDHAVVPAKTETENYSLEQPVTQNPIDTAQILADDFNDFPRVATLPAKDERLDNSTAQQKALVQQNITSTTPSKNVSAANGLYKKLETDTRVGKTVYFDGKSYNYQASSWRNKAKAEQEVKRLRGLGVEAFLTEAYLPEKGGTWYRVRIGSYKSKEEAEQNSIKK